MSTAAFRQRLVKRADRAHVAVTPAEVDQLEKYFELLRRWSARMNLTALQLEGPPDETLDRLFIEPLVAARFVSKAPLSWFDIGSGGGSPAIPLKVLRPHARLTMVESKGRKAAFLREVVRTLKLRRADVRNSRFEVLFGPETPGIEADLVTVRAVKHEPDLFQLCRRALSDSGELLLFRTADTGEPAPAGFKRLKTVQLTEAQAFVDILQAV